MYLVDMSGYLSAASSVALAKGSKWLPQLEVKVHTHTSASYEKWCKLGMPS